MAIVGDIKITLKGIDVSTKQALIQIEIVGFANKNEQMGIEVFVNNKSIYRTVHTITDKDIVSYDFTPPQFKVQKIVKIPAKGKQVVKVWVGGYDVVDDRTETKEFKFDVEEIPPEEKPPELPPPEEEKPPEEQPKEGGGGRVIIGLILLIGGLWLLFRSRTQRKIKLLRLLG